MNNLYKFKNHQQFKKINLPIFKYKFLNVDQRDYGNQVIVPDGFTKDLNPRKKKLLQWSKQRGMLENDLLLSSYAIKYLKDMDEKSVDQFEKLMMQPDQDILLWITKDDIEVPEEYNTELLKNIKEHVKSDPLKEQRQSK
eukprot:TRINITY_DN10767_c0_g1_i1.p1 TRINITY_DN10767_c0_g1~~TRINITY_DN10767_c0_g1_i1.p1  ORF type:complete len:140 (+),score=40.11 TRINITY_DN10767_c0_g1_i1:52-471(+)